MARALINVGILQEEDYDQTEPIAVCIQRGIERWAQTVSDQSLPFRHLHFSLKVTPDDGAIDRVMDIKTDRARRVWGMRDARGRRDEKAEDAWYFAFQSGEPGAALIGRALQRIEAAAPGASLSVIDALDRGLGRTIGCYGPNFLHHLACYEDDRLNDERAEFEHEEETLLEHFVEAHKREWTPDERAEELNKSGFWEPPEEAEKGEKAFDKAWKVTNIGGGGEIGGIKYAQAEYDPDHQVQIEEAGRRARVESREKDADFFGAIAFYMHQLHLLERQWVARQLQENTGVYNGEQVFPICLFPGLTEGLGGEILGGLVDDYHENAWQTNTAPSWAFAFRTGEPASVELAKEALENALQVAAAADKLLCVISHEWEDSAKER